MNSILTIIEANKQKLNSTLKINKYSFLVEFLQNDVRHTWDTENKVEE